MIKKNILIVGHVKISHECRKVVSYLMTKLKVENRSLNWYMDVRFHSLGGGEARCVWQKHVQTQTVWEHA